MQIIEYRSVQALRFAAAVAVVYYHACYWAGSRLRGPASLPVELGDASVWMFFTISGFVMLYVVDSGRETDPRVFALRRVARIFPLAWTMTTCKLVLIMLGCSVIVDGALSPMRIVSSYLFFPAAGPDGTVRMLWGVEWTLLFELAFYLLLAVALAVRVDPLALATPVLTLIAAASVMRPEHGPAVWFYASPVTLFFLAGMWIARCTRLTSVRRRAVAMGSVVVVLAGVFGCVALGRGEPSPLTTGLAFLGVTGVVAAAVLAEGRIGRLVPAWVLSGAAATYSLYLTHPIISQILPEALERTGQTQTWWLPVVIVSVIASVIAAMAIYRWFEQPMNRTVLRFLVRGTRGRVPAAQG